MTGDIIGPTRRSPSGRSSASARPPRPLWRRRPCSGPSSTGGALGDTARASALIGVGVLVVAAIGVAASLRAQDERAEGSSGAAVVSMGATVVCVAGLIGAVVYGIYLIAK